MLDSVTSLKGFRLNGLDGAIGHVKQFYFDDHFWTIRHLVADTGGWLPRRQVLISPYALGAIDRAERRIAVDLTKRQIEESPPLHSDQPVSRQFEERYFGYYAWPMYWTTVDRWGVLPYLPTDRTQRHTDPPGEKPTWDPHLRSTEDVTGHRVAAVDGMIGDISDFIVDDQTWAIRYLVIDTHDWLIGKQVLVAPRWIARISWPEQTVFVTVTRETIQRSPEYIDWKHVTREYEERLYAHYRARGYWNEEATPGIPTPGARPGKTGSDDQ
ncbi:MAG: PRC-barrel domain containing protein [Gemmatimonadaceae bacterium]|nr:PRC-barrel domain containing protein [Gemmatimonadaceae bacterium]